MKINDRGQAVWDQKEYIQGLIDASEFDREESLEPCRERPRNVTDEARQESIREAEMERRAWESDMAFEKAGVVVQPRPDRPQHAVAAEERLMSTHETPAAKPHPTETPEYWRKLARTERAFAEQDRRNPHATVESYQIRLRNAADFEANAERLEAMASAGAAIAKARGEEK